MNAKRSLLETIQSGSFALLTADEIARKLRLGGRERAAVREMLLSLCREGELLTDSRGRFGTAAQFCAQRGVFSGNERGFGFFTPEGGGDDWFIPHRSVNGALHGDTVLAFRLGGRSGDEGEILAVLGRGYRELVGTYRREGRAGRLHPDEKNYCAEVFIPAGKSGSCPDGAKAVAKIVSFAGGTPTGEIVEVLGAAGDLLTEENALIRAHRLREDFPEDVLKNAVRVARPISPKQREGRLDLTEELIITVDGEDTRDIDDAISIRKEGGIFRLGVHIADVSEYVTRGSALDKEAFLRGTSVYFPDRVLPMLPKELSNGVCSLNEGEERLTLSCLMTVGKRGEVLSRRIVPSRIRSRHRMTYTEVAKLAEGDPETCARYPDLADFIPAAVELTGILKRAREARGSVALDVKEAKILYSDGKIEIPPAGRLISHEMIEQFMVLANESVAREMTERRAPFVYRVHEQPSEDKAREFAAFLTGLGLRADFDPLRVSPADYRRLLEGLEGSPLAAAVNRVMLRSMMKAHYSPVNAGHFGLASECYCHFTSPIRRYPDLAIHRIIKEALAGSSDLKEKFGEFAEKASVRSSACEKVAADAERDVDSLYAAFYMKDKIGETFGATVSGVTSFGVFAELENAVEGMIPVETLDGDWFEFDEERRVLTGVKRSFRIGDELTVTVVGVDIGARRTLFTLKETK